MESPQDVGEVLLLRVHKAPLLLPAPIGPLSRDAWFCRWFQLTPPQGVPLRFPCYQWLDGAVSLALRAGPGEPGRRGGPGGGERQGRGKAGRCGPWGGERAAHCGSKGPGAGARGGGGRCCFSALITRSCALTAKVSGADDHPTLQQQRQEELQARQDSYQ